MTTRPVRDCTCPQANHQHGTTGAYIRDRCRCEPCTLAAARDRKRRSVAAHRGQGNKLVDPARMLQHIENLNEEWGITHTAVLETAGLSRVHARELFKGDNGGRVTTATEKAVLAINLHTIDERHRMDARGVSRRLQALGVNGWTSADIEPYVPVGPDALSRVRAGKATRCTVATHKAVAAVFDRWWNTRPVSGDVWEERARNKVRNRAAREGWVPAAMWDDIDHDERPATATRNRGGQGIDPEDLRHLVESGVSTDRIAETFGVTWGAVLLAAKGRGDAELHRTLIRRRETEAITRRDYQVAA